MFKRPDQNTAPFFEAQPGDVPTIPCLSSPKALDWAYALPKAVDAEYDTFYYDFNSNTINNSVILSEDDATLYLDPSATQPDSGNYLLTIKLFDVFHATQEYELEMIFECE